MGGALCRRRASPDVVSGGSQSQTIAFKPNTVDGRDGANLTSARHEAASEDQFAQRCIQSHSNTAIGCQEVGARMHVIFVCLNGSEINCERAEDDTIAEARKAAAAILNVRIGWVSLVLNEVELLDDHVCLKDLVSGSSINLTMFVRSPWSWALKVDDTVRTLDHYATDPELGILFEHFNAGNGEHGHGRVVVAGRFPSTPDTVLAFLRGMPDLREAAVFSPSAGIECWALDESATGGWRPGTIRCCADSFLLLNHFTVEWMDGGGGDGQERRIISLQKLGSLNGRKAREVDEDAAMTKAELQHALCDLRVAEEKVNLDDVWRQLQVAEGSLCSISNAEHMVPRSSTHDSVKPYIDELEGKVAPWWDVLELKEVGPSHVAKAARQCGPDVAVPADHAKRAARALRGLIGASPDASDEIVTAIASRCKFYTHSRTVCVDGLSNVGEFYKATGCGWDPLVIAANPEEQTIAFAFATDTD